MIECTAEMFSHLPENKQDSGQLRRLCPDVAAFQDKLKVKGTYSNYEDRHSFQIQGVLCDQQ